MLQMEKLKKNNALMALAKKIKVKNKVGEQ